METQHLSTLEAAELLNCSPHSLNQSRSNGLLFGQPAPLYIKIGKTVRYKRSTLIKWQNNFVETEAKK